MRSLIKIKLLNIFQLQVPMSRHLMFNAAALACLSLHDSTHVATLSSQCRGMHYSARNSLSCYFPMLRHWILNAVALGILPIF